MGSINHMNKKFTNKILISKIVSTPAAVGLENCAFGLVRNQSEGAATNIIVINFS
jgi:hypothetical protein